MTLSVNTNQPALIALQNLNKTNDDMQGVQSASTRVLPFPERGTTRPSGRLRRNSAPT